MSGCSSNPKLPAKPTLSSYDSTTIAAAERTDRYDPLVYCGSDGAFRCPQVTPKTVYVPPAPPAPVLDPNTLMNDAAAGLAAGAGTAASGTAGSQAAKPTHVAFSNVLFDFNKSVLSGEAQAQLTAMLPDLKGKGVQLAGFTDGIGTESYNDKLALARAKAVQTFLVKGGLAAAAIEIQGDGVCCYVAPNDSDESRRLNRRVEIRLKAN